MLFTRENEDKKIVWKGIKDTSLMEEDTIQELEEIGEIEVELPPEGLEDLNPEENEGL